MSTKWSSALITVLSAFVERKIIEFINFWDKFHNKPFLSKNNGMHFNSVEATHFDRLSNNNISDFRRKKNMLPCSALTT